MLKTSRDGERGLKYVMRKCAGEKLKQGTGKYFSDSGGLGKDFLKIQTDSYQWVFVLF